MNSHRVGLQSTAYLHLRGHGYIAGEAPTGPDDPNDGRFKRLNVPSRGRITVHDRTSLRIVAATLSETDGTWQVGGLRPGVPFVVIGWDDTGAINAAVQDWVYPYAPAP